MMGVLERAAPLGWFGKEQLIRVSDLGLSQLREQSPRATALLAAARQWSLKRCRLRQSCRPG